MNVLTSSLITLFGIDIRRPEQIPITDQSMSIKNNKRGMGILIRILLRKEQQKQDQHDDDDDVDDVDDVDDEKEEETEEAIDHRPSTESESELDRESVSKLLTTIDKGSGDDDNDDDDDDDDDEGEEDRNNTDVVKGDDDDDDDDDDSDSEKDSDDSNSCDDSDSDDDSDEDNDDDDDNEYHDTDYTYYRPQPGDICIIRYDVYTLSPIVNNNNNNNSTTHDTNLHPNAPSSRQRTWIDGNFNNTPTGRMCLDSETKKVQNKEKGEQFETGPDYRRPPARHTRQFPALEFEVGKGDVIRGLEVGVQRMYENDISELTIPHLYGYGHRGHHCHHGQYYAKHPHSLKKNDHSNNNNNANYNRLIKPKTDLVMIVKLLQIIITDKNKKEYQNHNIDNRNHYNRIRIINNTIDNDDVDNNNNNANPNNDNEVVVDPNIEADDIMGVLIHGFCETFFLLFLLATALFMLFVPTILLLFSYIPEDSEEENNLHIYVNSFRHYIRSTFVFEWNEIQ